MARTLLATSCNLQNNGSYGKQDTYYDPDLRAAQTSPIDSETSYPLTCTPFQIAPNQQVDSYCAVDANGIGFRRKVFTEAGGSGNVQFYRYADSADISCSAACNLAITYQQAFPTSSTGATDGQLVIEANSTHPPIVIYVPGLGSPTTTTIFNPTSGPGQARAYQFVYKNVKAGSYAAALQDNGNCQLNSKALTVSPGAALGTVGLPTGYRWFKYEYRRSVTNGGGDDGTISGYAWNPTTKQGYQVAPIPLQFPAFNNRRDWDKGDIVSWIPDGQDVRYYYRAAQDLRQSDTRFDTDDHRIPNPHQQNVDAGYWQYVTYRYDYHLQFLYKGTLISNLYDPFFQKKTSLPGGDYHYYYPEGTVVRFDWTGFYRAKKGLESNLFPNSTLPSPTLSASDANWEKVEGYDDFYYAIEESQVIDQYQLGSTTRRVRYHLNVPEVVDVPSTALYDVAPDGDFILYDDSIPDVETQLGDLKVIDITKTDVDMRGAENGSVAILAQSPSEPILFHLRNGVRPGYIQDNTTGIYENLHPGDYIVDIYDSLSPQPRYVTAEFTIEDRYQARWKLTYDDVRGTDLETLIFERDFAGTVTNVCGSAEPTILSWDSGGDPGGYLPEGTGSTLQFNLLTTVVQQFAETAEKDDRMYRVDHYRAGKLQFRGYIDSTTYRERLLGPGQEVQLTAADGLGQLKSTKFVNHLLERQYARTNQLSIILKCLSFTDVNLPLLVGLNLRERLMAVDADPLVEAYVHRSAYQKKDGKVLDDEDLIDCRTVINGILRNYNAMIFQADGCWKIISFSEVYGDFAVRAYSPAGTLLPNFDTSSQPLRILEDKLATGARELYWINGTQDRTTIGAAYIVKASVDLQLETNLFENGNFVLWNLDTPTYWSTIGAPGVTRAPGEKVGEDAVQFAGYDDQFHASKYLLSPPAPHLSGQEEDYMQVTFRSCVDPLTTNPAAATVTVYFQVLDNGQPYGSPIPVDLSSKDKWKDNTFDIPFGVLTSTSVRVRMLAPQVTSGTVLSKLRVNSIEISIQPGLRNWSKQTTDYVYVQNNVTTRIGLDDVELVHADLPRLPGNNNTTLPPKAMDVFAWRHAVSYKDYTATTEWKRPDAAKYYPLLDCAGQDRLVMREYPATQISGEVSGPGIDYLRQGLMLDMPQDVEGKYVIISCFKSERSATASIMVRKLLDGFYGDVNKIPDHVRIGTASLVPGYRIGYKNGKWGYRIGHK